MKELDNRVTLADAAAMLGISRVAVTKKLTLLGIEPIQIRKGNTEVQGLTPEHLRHLRSSRAGTSPVPGRPLVLSFQGCKGGIGKSTLSYNFALRASQYGLRVLCIDTDQQSHLTLCLCGKAPGNRCWYDLLEGQTTLREAIVPWREYLHIVPGTIHLALIDYKYNDRAHPEALFGRYLEEVEADYDLVVVDCAPSLSLLNQAVAYASDRIVIPQTPSRLSFDGLELTINFLEDLHENFEKQLDVRILCNMVEPDELSSIRIISHLSKTYGEALCRTFVHRSQTFLEAIDAGTSVFDYTLKADTARDDLDALTRELLADRLS